MASEAVPFIEQNLMPGEWLIASARIHSATVTVPAVLLALPGILLVVGLVLGQNGLPRIILGCALAVFLGLVVLDHMIQRATTEFGLTDKRIVIKSGWVTTQVREMPLGQVEAIRLEQEIFGKLFGFGSLVTIGSGGTRRTCANIADPFDFYKRVQEQVRMVQDLDCPRDVADVPSAGFNVQRCWVPHSSGRR
ncbi:MAG TPA: PH domain-containing protein [Gemmataceae bacterium]|nr:PH domain-containing protein [Gemmataceae bacterium]